MIPLMPGCTVSQNIRVVISDLTEDVIQWFVDSGGDATTDHQLLYQGQRRVSNTSKTRIKYGQGKWCYRLQDGTGNVLLHFQGEDAGMAMVFIMKFNELIVSHNFPEFSHECT